MESANISAKDAIPEIKALKKVKVLKPTDKQYGIIDINSGNENYENFYKEYLSITNDPTLKESLTLLIITSKPQNLENRLQSSIMKTKRRKNVLESLKGKYVYIDVYWALVFSRSTIPAKVEEQYQGKNIEFVSISVDNIKDREKWSNLVNKKQLGGIQLLADKNSIPSLLNNIAFCKSKVYSNRPKWQHCKFQCSQTIRNRTD
jgi:hypothetical protein